MTDFWIAVALAVITIGIMGFLGFHVTIHSALSRRAQIAYQIAFCFFAVIATGLIGLQAYRSYQTQKKNDQLLSDIQAQNTKTILYIRACRCSLKQAVKKELFLDMLKKLLVFLIGLMHLFRHVT